MGRVPPNSLDSEGAILSQIFASPRDLDRCRSVGLKPEHFYADANRYIYEAILVCDETQMGIDLPTIAYHLRSSSRLDRIGGTPYLAQLVELIPAVSNIEQHCRIVFDCWRARQVIAIQQTSIAEIYQAQGAGAQEAFEGLEVQIWEIAHQSREATYERAGDIAGRALGLIAEALQSGTGMLGKTTGFRELDEQTSGYQSGDLIIIAARPGIGKTSMACSSLLQTSRVPDDGSLPDAVYFHSCEMPRDQIALRLVCILAGVSFQLLRTGKVGREEWTSLYRAAATLKQQPLFVDDKPAVTVAEIRANIRKIKREIEIGVVKAAGLALTCVDYLQLMQGERGQGREREISSISQGLKNTAKNEAVCMVALSQLNREVEKRNSGPKDHEGKTKTKRPQLSDLRESGAIEQDADSVWFLYRENYYDKSADDEAEIIISKQRNGPTGTVYITFDGPTTTFKSKPRLGEEFHDFGDDPRFSGGDPGDDYR